MQGLKGVIVVATLVAATVALGGCFGHHEKAVVSEPLKLGSATSWSSRLFASKLLRLGNKGGGTELPRHRTWMPGRRSVMRGVSGILPFLGTRSEGLLPPPCGEVRRREASSGWGLFSESQGYSPPPARRVPANRPPHRPRGPPCFGALTNRSEIARFSIPSRHPGVGDR